MYIPFEKLPPSSRVWVYQADRSFSPEEENQIDGKLTAFCSAWEAHGYPLSTSFKVESRRFIILAVDENSAGASGCSIDGSVRVLKDLGDQCNINFFDRTKVAFIVHGEIETYSLTELKSLFESAKLQPSVQTFNTLISSKAEWETHWKTTAEKSWLVKYLPKDTLSV